MKINILSERRVNIATNPDIPVGQQLIYEDTRPNLKYPEYILTSKGDEKFAQVVIDTIIKRGAKVLILEHPENRKL